MRESTGGLLLLQLVVIIVFVFIFFIASVMQYSRVYRIKGTIIEAIERGEGGIRDKGEFESVLEQAGYKGPYILCKVTDSNRGTYYQVQIYANFTLLPQFASVKVPIRGDTRTIQTGVFYDDSQDTLFESAITVDGNQCITNEK